MIVYVDIDLTISETTGSDYENSQPIYENIAKINKLYHEGNEIVYWTARGGKSRINWYSFTKGQLDKWGCKYHQLSFQKPSFDLLIDDKSKRIDEII
jgi:hypothetical protein